MKHKPSCRCVECEMTNRLREANDHYNFYVSQPQVRRWRTAYRKAMRMLARINEGLYRDQPTRPYSLLHCDINAIVAKRREGKQ